MVIYRNKNGIFCVSLTGIFKYFKKMKILSIFNRSKYMFQNKK